MSLIPFVQKVVDVANEKFTDEIARLDYLNEEFQHGIFIGKAENLSAKVKNILLEQFSLRNEPPKGLLRRRK